MIRCIDPTRVVPVSPAEAPATSSARRAGLD